MEEDKDIDVNSIKQLSSTSKETLSSLASLNRKTFNFFNDYETKSLLKQINVASIPTINVSYLASASDEISSAFNTLTNTVNKIANAYKDVFASFEVSRKALESVANIQMNTIFQLSQSVQTDMIKGISNNLANARYDLLAGTINESINNSIIPTPDIGFICSSGILKSVKSELTIPKGLTSTLGSINLLTAKELSYDDSIQYISKHNKFVSKEGSGETNAKGLNIICSSRCILDQTQKEEVFSLNELVDFISFLSETPMLASDTETGRRIKSLIKNLFDEGKRTIDFDKAEYYHCRSRKESEMEYTFQEMLSAPHGLPWAGRFNHIGSSHYYFADTREGAEVEVKKHLSNNDVLQTVRIIPKKEVVLLDLSGTWQRYSLFLKYLRFSLHDNTEKMPREYLLPCFVSDCCHLVGFDGIKFYGSEKYNNYVTWGSDCFNFGGMCL